MKRHPHTMNFYRKRYRGFCRRMVIVVALLILGVIGHMETSLQGLGKGLIQIGLLVWLEVYFYSVGIGFKKEENHVLHKQSRY